MNTNELPNCGPCANILCSQYGCQKEWGRSLRHPFVAQPPNVVPSFQQYYQQPVTPGAQPFNAQERIVELEKRVNDLENRLWELEGKQ